MMQRMPIEYRVDEVGRIIFATPKGTMTPEDMMRYIKEIGSRPELKNFNELVDMRGVDRVEHGSAWKVREMAGQAAEMDEPGGLPTRLAIVAEQDHHFGLARMYQAFREANPKSTREVRAFRSYDEALRWLSGQASSGKAGSV